MANPLLDALLADREGNSASGFSPMSAPTPAAGARMIDFDTPLPEMTPDAATSEDTLAFPPEEVDQTYTPLDAPEPAESSAEIAPAPRANPLLAALQADQAATQQAVAEATTPDDRLPIATPELADALGVLDYRDPQEGQRRQQAAAVGEILNLPMFERVNLGAAPVNPDGTVTIRRAQAVSPEAQAAADARMANIRTMAAGEMLVEESPKEVGTLQGIANAAQNAFDSARQALMATDGLDANDASEIARIEYNKAARRVAPGYAAYQQAEGWDAAKAFAKNPFEVTTNIITEGLAGSWPALAGGLATGATTAAVTGVAGSVVPVVGNVIGAGGGFTAGMIGGTGAGSFATEYGGKILEELQTAGMNPKDPESIANFFSNETLMAEAKDAALKRGVPVAAFDALSAGIAGRVGSVFRAAAKTPVRLAVTEAAIQGGLGGAGEVAGSVAAGDPVNPKAVFGEVIGEVGPAAIEIAAGRAASATQPAPGEVPQNFTPISSPAPAPGPVAPAPAPQNLGQVRAPEIPIDQTALDEAFGPPPAAVNPQVNPDEVSNDTFAPPAATPRPAFSFSTDAITPEQTALATDFSNRLTGQLRTQGILDTASTLDLAPVNLDRVDAGAPLADFIDNFSRLTGTRIQFVKASDPTIFGGAVRSDDAQTIYLNADSQRPVASLIGHEYGHTLQYSNPALYKDLRRVVATYTDSYRTRARESAAAPIYRTGTATQRVRTQAAELTNNTLGDAFLDPEFWRSVQNENRPLIQKIWTSFNEWVDSLLTRQSQATWGTPQFSTDLTALRRDLAKTIAPALRPPTRSFGNAQVTAKPGVIDLAIEAYHGTPHKVDRFSTKKIGTGEGAQVYGWGLYFAEKFGVAKKYRDDLTPDPVAKINKHLSLIGLGGHSASSKLAEKLVGNGGDLSLASSEFRKEGNKQIADLIDKRVKEGRKSLDVNKGNLYTVELDVELEDLLDWDKPLSEQSEKIRNGLASAFGVSRDAIEYWTGRLVDDLSENGPSGYSENRLNRVINEAVESGGYGEEFGFQVWDEIKEAAPEVAEEFIDWVKKNSAGGIATTDTGESLYRLLASTKGSPKAASEAILAAGIPGIRYLDGDSRAEGQGTSNYVIFDENLIKVTGENGQPVSREIAFASEPKPATTATMPEDQRAAETSGQPSRGGLSAEALGKLDTDYLAAIERGDMETAQGMVHKAAKLAGFNQRVFHGSPKKFQGSQFKKSTFHDGFFFTNDLELARYYAEGEFNEGDVENVREFFIPDTDHRIAFADQTDDESLAIKAKNHLRRNNDAVVELADIKDTYEGEFYQPGTSVFAVWEPSKIKSADSVIRDDAGNVIPLSQRFFSRPAPSPGAVSLAAEPKPRKFTQSVQAAPGVAPEVKAQLTALDYDPISNAQTLASARARIDAAGSMDSAVTQFMGNAANPDFQPTAVDYATGIELMGQLQARGRHEDSAAIADFMARAGTTQGQAIQYLSVISRLEPAGIEAFAARQITRAARNDPKIEELIQDNQRLRAEIATAKRDSATAAIVDNRAAIKAALPAGADPVATNIAIREAILQSPTPLAAQAATARILQDNGLSERAAIRIAQSITKDFLKTTTDSRAKVLQDLLALAEKDRRFNKSKIGSLIRLNREGKLTDSRLHADMAKMLGIPAWTPEHSAKVQDLLRQRAAATDPRVKLVKAAEALDVIYRESMPAGMLAKIDTFQTLMMLLNPKTWIRNIGGNAFMFGADLSADTVAWGADAATSIVTGSRTRTGLDLATRITELGAGLGDIRAGYEFGRTQGLGRLGSFKEGVQTLIRLGRLYSSKKYDSAEITGFTGTTFQSGIGKVLEDTLGAALSLADRGFYESAFRASLDNRMRTATANGSPLAAPDPDMIAEARIDASRSIYQDDNSASRTLSGLRRVLNANQRWGLGSMLMKFTQVPGSILMRGIEFSPLGFIRNAYQLLAPALSRRAAFDQKAFTEQFSRALVGTTGLVATGYWLAQLGIISAGRENEDEKKRNLAKAEGWGSYKLNVSALKRALITGNFWTRQPRQDGDVVLNYDWAQPLSISVAMGAYARDNQKAVQEDILRGKKQSLLATGFNWMSAAAASATGAMNALVEQPLLSGLSTFFRNAAYDDIPGAILAAASDVPKSMMPTAARQWMQLDDNTVRETRDSSPFRQYVNELKSQLPGLSQTLPAKRDILGNDVERYQRDSNTVFNVLFNPSMVTYIKRSPLLTEMSQVYEMTGNPSVIPNQAGRDFTLEGVKVRLTTEEISALQKDMGALSVAAVEKFVLDDPRYDKATWDIKAKAFTRALEKAATASKYRILLSRPDLKQRAQIEHQQTIQRRQEMQQMLDSGVGAALMQ